MVRDQQGRPTHRYALDADERPSRGVYTAVADARGCSALDLQPLADAIDPDAIDRLLAGDGGPNVITFEYCGYEVEVTAVEVRIAAIDDR